MAMVLRTDDVVTKRNVLNELRAKNMTLQELRFFSIYLSKINPRKPETRRVRFPLEDFRAIMELGRMDIGYMKRVTDALLCKIVHLPLEKGYEAFQLFKKCKIANDGEGWYFEIDAHDDALPLMFDFKERFFAYKLYNALRLRSANQLRMYEVLKQYEWLGERVLTIDELKDLMGIKKDEYNLYYEFKRDVLTVCQRAMEQHTDIKFTFAPHGRKGPGGKILALKFKIEKNDGYEDQITLDMFIEERKQLEEAPAPADIDDYREKYKNSSDSLSGGDGDEEEGRDRHTELVEKHRSTLGNEFSFAEVELLLTEMSKHMPVLDYIDEDKCGDYLRDRYLEMNRHGGKVKKRFNYLLSLVKKTI